MSDWMDGDRLFEEFCKDLEEFEASYREWSRQMHEEWQRDMAIFEAYFGDGFGTLSEPQEQESHGRTNHKRKGRTKRAQKRR